MTRFAVLQVLRPVAFARLGIFLTIAMLCGSARAQLIYADNFDYPNGPIVAMPNSPWTNNYAPSNQINVVSGRLVLTQTNEESIRRPFPASYGKPNLFAGFQVTFSALPKGNGNYFAFIRADGDTLFCRLRTTTNDTAPGKFRLGLTTISSPYLMIPTDLSLNVTYNIVMQYTVTNISGENYGTSRLWINPSSQDDTTRSVEVTENVGGYGYASFGFKQIAYYEDHANGMGDLTVDNLRIGLSFAVAQPPPMILSFPRAPDGTVGVNGLVTPTNGYWLQSNSNLATADWVNVSSNASDIWGNIQFTDNTAGKPAQFYRLYKP